MEWFAIFVKTGKEDMICSLIHSKLKDAKYEYELLVPKRRIQERHHGEMIEVVTKMFPGYILIRTDYIWDFFHQIEKLENVYRLLNHNGQIEEISLDEISNIIYMVDNEGVIGISDIFVENNAVKVIDGPLRNYIGWIKKLDKRKHRAKVIFQFNGSNHLIDLSVNFIENCNGVVEKEIPFFDPTLFPNNGRERSIMNDNYTLPDCY